MPLLYPVQSKDYQSDEFIAHEWNNLELGLSNAYYVTLFGYGSPKTDAEARRIFLSAWESNHGRELNQVEFINICSREEIKDTWDGFLSPPDDGGRIHWSLFDDFEKSTLYLFPRRSCEQLRDRSMMLEPWRENPFPDFDSLEGLQSWGSYLVEEERAFEDDEGELTDDPVPWPPPD